MHQSLQMRIDTSFQLFTLQNDAKSHKWRISKPPLTGRELRIACIPCGARVLRVRAIDDLRRIAKRPAHHNALAALIHAPFRDIAQHVMQTTCIRLFGSNRMCLSISIACMPRVIVQVEGFVEGARCLPLLNGRQAIRLASAMRQPLTELLCTPERHRNGWVTAAAEPPVHGDVRLGRSRHSVEIALLDLIAAVHEEVVEIPGDLCRTDPDDISIVRDRHQ